MRIAVVYIVSWLIFGLELQAQVKPLPALKVSSNGRYFQTADGNPFFWLGDTGWLLFVKCNREEAIHYLDTRQKQGFNVVQVMVLHDLSNTVNVYGDSALVGLDVSRPKLTTGNDPADATAYDFWDHVDFIINEAEKRGIYMALVPVWGSSVKAGKVNPKQGTAYAKFLTGRYKDKSNIIWLNGGDIKGTDGIETWKAIGETIRKNDKQHLMTFHPRGRTSSSDWFHQESWLDFNMFQSGHKNYAQDTNRNETNHYGEDNWKFVNVDYKLKPIKPTLDGEPSYENIPHGLHDSTQPRWKDADLRRYAYWSVFAGGAGFTYGENAVMQFNSKGDKGANFGVTDNWKVAINAPGAEQMQNLSRLMLSQKSYFDRVPAQDILVDNTGNRYDYLLATKGKKFAMVYTYNSNTIKVDPAKLDFQVKRISWYDPATGQGTSHEINGDKMVMMFNPPAKTHNGKDWVLLLE